MSCRTGLSRPHYVRFLLIVIFTGCFDNFATASDLKNFNQEIRKLDNVSVELRNKVLSALTLVKELEKNIPVSGSQIAKVIYPEEPVRDANFPDAKSIFTARYNDEFIILDKRDKWYHIKLPDGRDGWIHEDAVQAITTDRNSGYGGKQRSKINDQALLLQLVIFYEEIESEYRLAKNIMNHVETLYSKLSSDEKFNYSDQYKRFFHVKSKIEKYHSYADKYLQPYSSMVEGVKISNKKKLASRGSRFTGNASLEFGKAIQNTTSDQSGFAGNFDFNGLYRINSSTSVRGAIRHHEDVIRTPFATTGVEVGLKNQFRKNIGLDATVGYEKYNDKFDDVNDFNLIRASANLNIPFGKGSRLSGFIGHSARKYTLGNGNNFGSTRYQISAFLKNNPKFATNIFIRGNLQSSNVDYLNFDQINPGIVMTRNRVPGKSFSTLMDLNVYKYSGEAARSNFSRARLDFKWLRSEKGKNKTSFLGFIGKAFPNNKRLNYLRGNLAFTTTKNNLVNGRTKTSRFRSIYTYYVLQDTTKPADFMDLRYDIMNQGRKWFIGFNVFGRFINTIGRSVKANQTLDMYLTTGPVISNRKTRARNIYRLKIGPVLGAHGLFRPDTKFWENNGTSLRLGLSLQGDMNIGKAYLRFMGAYERQFLVTNQYKIDKTSGELAVGDVTVREPNTYQCDIDFRMPVIKALDVRFNLNYYNILTDVDEATSFNPNEQNMRLRLVGGVIYRFVL